MHRVFVDGRSRTIIMENMRDRIARADIRQERLEAIQVRRPEDYNIYKCSHN